MSTRFMINAGIWAAFTLILMMMFGQPFYMVDNGYAGVETCWGKVQKGAISAGPGVKLPWCEITQVQVQTRTLKDVKINAPTIDLQELNGEATVQYAILSSAADEAYGVLGAEADIEENIILPGLHESTKVVTAQYTGTKLFYARDVAQLDMSKALQEWVDNSAKARKLNRLIVIQSVVLTKANFTNTFETALQNKAIRDQVLQRAGAKRDTQLEDAKAKAAIVTRNADADAANIRLNAEAEAQGMKNQAEQLLKNPQLLCYQARSKWKGTLSEIGHGATPFDELCRGK
ncbi:MAG TPA: SPFH domain-containing protein [Candidatus Obscuribacter sp.]|nr:hypothetical protein [Candidatus Obscuribacter sp.]HMW89972.1 SPFH domain-containing protein [Candidatus Obscuribacter sp.]HMY52019.1 SPFH domain-containing protein [Candidatus Obscuribacter sp.]HNB16897.1 SPFH domain-containing protein [Candidatus Obscuribacter sp.]HNG18421.1 SPFH domain-containing protein [Candidatus Obscuribacter sp.]